MEVSFGASPVWPGLPRNCDQFWQAVVIATRAISATTHRRRPTRSTHVPHVHHSLSSPRPARCRSGHLGRQRRGARSQSTTNSSWPWSRSVERRVGGDPVLLVAVDRGRRVGEVEVAHAPDGQHVHVGVGHLEAGDDQADPLRREGLLLGPADEVGHVHQALVQAGGRSIQWSTSTIGTTSV